jgi:uncharacterized phiE125 gp8 family phage protein
VLIVTVPAESFDLVLIDDVRDALGITDSSEDENLARWISQASGAVAKHLNRVLAQETVMETFRLSTVTESLLLSRYPVSSIVSVTEFDTALVSTDYELHAASGVLTRLSDDELICWSAGKVGVTYVSGFALDDVPDEIVRAVIMLVSQYRFSGERDPQLRSETTDGAGSSSYFDGQEVGGMSPEVRGLLADHRKPAGS